MSRFHEPGKDGKWLNPGLPTTLEAAQERICVLEVALMWYSNAKSYDPESRDNECPAYDELMKDAGLRARLGRLSADVAEFVDWYSALYASGVR